jgi:hypothetical protein
MTVSGFATKGENMKVIGVIGTRSRDAEEDFYKVYDEFFKHYIEGDSICSGLCPKGGDRFAILIANKLALSKDKRLWFPANWEKFGKGAGFVRNTDIAENSDILIACASKNRTGGTEDTIKKFLKRRNKSNLFLV